MENESRFSRWVTSISEKIQDQVWFQQGKAKWDELDHKTRMAIRYALLGGSSLLLLFLVISSAVSVQSKKRELDDKLALTQKIRASQDELMKLREITSRAAPGNSSQPWSEYLSGQAQTSGIDPATIKVSDEKIAASASKDRDDKSEKPKEAMLDVSVKKVNLRQLVGFVYNLENGPRPTKVRNLSVETQPDESGYLDVTVSLSAFTFKGER